MRLEMELELEEKSLNGAFVEVVKSSLGVEPIFPGSHREKYLLKSDVKRDVHKACVARDIEAFEQRITASDADTDAISSTDDEEEPAQLASFDWSREACTLHGLLQQKSNWRMAYASELYRYFKHLSLRRMGIRQVTEEVERFSSLEELNVCGNQIKSITVLPENLVTLHAYDNLIAFVDIGGGVAHTLVHLGIGYNKLKIFPPCLKRLRALESLDISYNCFTDLTKVLQNAKDMTKLTRLGVYGNPFCLLANYRTEIEHQLPALETLDDVKCGEPGSSSPWCLNTREFTLRIDVTQLVVNGILDPTLQDNGVPSNRSNYVQLEAILPDGTAVSSELAGPITPPAPSKKGKQPEVTNSEELELDVDFSHSITLPITIDVRDKIDLEGLLLRATLVSQEVADDSVDSQETPPVRYGFGALQLSLRPMLAASCNGQTEIRLEETSFMQREDFTEGAFKVVAKSLKQCVIALNPGPAESETEHLEPPESS